MLLARGAVLSTLPKLCRLRTLSSYSSSRCSGSNSRNWASRWQTLIMQITASCSNSSISNKNFLLQAVPDRLLNSAQMQVDLTKLEGAFLIAVEEISRKFLPRQTSILVSRWLKQALQASLRSKCSKAKRILNLVKSFWLSKSIVRLLKCSPKA